MITVAIIIAVVSVLYCIYQRYWNRGVLCSSGERVDGKVVLITGATGALGGALAMELARRGGTIVMASRNLDRAEVIAKDIREKTNNEKVSVLYVDMAVMGSVRKFAEKFMEEHERLDILLHCAGVCGLPFSMTEDGLELTMATNHFGPFLLTGLLIDLLSTTGSARVISLSGHAHIFAKFNISELCMPQQSYSWSTAYCNSQLVNILTVKEAARRLPSMCDIAFLTVHPGLVYTPLYHSMALVRYLPWLAAVLGRIFMKSVHEGIQTPLYCAVAPEAVKLSGRYLSNCELSNPIVAGMNVGHSRIMWNKSCKVVGLEHFLAEPRPEPTSSDEEEGTWKPNDSNASSDEFDLEDTMDTLQFVGLDELQNL